MGSEDEVSLRLEVGLLALREGLISQDQLCSAYDRWTAAKERSIGEILVEQGALETTARDRLELQATGASRSEQNTDDLSLTVAYEEPPLARKRTRTKGRDEETSAERSASQRKPSRYQIIRLHARGGLGEVYLAADPKLKRQVAIKAIQASHAHDPISQARFIQEAEVTGRLEHPGIVPVYALGQEPDGRPYYVMRFIEGETLKAAIERYHSASDASKDDRGRQVAFRRLLQSFVAACNAVAYAHSRGVVHRDLKPENIMLGPFGETLVVDWGIAKTQSDKSNDSPIEPATSTSHEDSSLTRPGAAVGTPRYMSPEQAAGDLASVGVLSDVYSLGATFYCLLVGHSPFPNGGVLDILDHVRRGIFPSPRNVRRSIDPELESICLKAMATRAEDRYSSPLEMAAAVENWLADVQYRGDHGRALNEVKGSLTRLCIERAQNLFGKGRHNEGLLWLTRALENLPEDSPSLDRVVRANLGSWHARTRLLERSLNHGGVVRAAAFSPDGHRLASAGNGVAAKLWDVATGRQMAELLGHRGPITVLAYSPDGSRLITAGQDGTLRIWEALSGLPVGLSCKHSGAVLSAQFSPDGAFVATLCEGHLPCLWRIADGEAIRDASPSTAVVTSLAFSLQGDLIAAGSDDGGFHLWTTRDGAARQHEIRHPSPIACLAFQADGESLVTGCHDGKIRRWNLATSKMLGEFPLPSGITQIRPGTEGMVVAAACADGSARLWNSEKGQPIGEPLIHGDRIDCLVFNPDGTMLATGSRDKTIRLWDTATGLPLGPPLEHRGAVNSLSFSPDGRRLVSGCSDGSVRSWRAAPRIPGDVERLACWIRVTTGLDFDAGDAIQKLDSLVGWELQRRLQDLGGPPHKKIEKW